MRRAIVHIGLPRTGTTTFQRVLHGRRDELAARGVLYPDLTPRSADQPHLSHQHLGEALDGRRPAHERTELLHALDGMLGATACDVAILSYEGLCWRSGWRPGVSVPRRLRALFAARGFAMETLVSVKPQAEYLNSMYTLRMQWLNEGRPFPAYLDSQLGSRRLDYDRLVRPWHAESDGRVHVVPVRDARTDQPLVARMLAEIGLLDRMDGLLEGALSLVENPSPGPATVEVCRRLRLAGGRRRFGDRVREATRAISAAARGRGLDAASFRGVDADLRARVWAGCLAANDRLARMAWGAPWSSRVAEAPPHPVNEIAGRPVAPALEAELAALFGEAWAGFGRE